MYQTEPHARLRGVRVNAQADVIPEPLSAEELYRIRGRKKQSVGDFNWGE